MNDVIEALEEATRWGDLLAYIQEDQCRIDDAEMKRARIATIRQHIADLRAGKLARQEDAGAHDAALAERVFKDGHWAGWCDNQRGRDAQFVAAAKEWAFYVSNGALAKSIEAADAIERGEHLRGGE